MSEADSKPVIMYRLLTREEKKKLETPIILNGSYTLNNSETKRVSVGLQPQANGGIKPVIKLQNNNTAGGIVLDTEGWRALQEKIPQIADYFSGNCDTYRRYSKWTTPSPLNIDGQHDIIFTTSFGSKSIVLDRSATSHNAEDEDSEEDEEEAETNKSLRRSKRRRIFTPAVVMQHTSFIGLCNVIPCIEERLKYLQQYLNNVKECCVALCTELRLYLPADEKPVYITESRIEELLKANHDALEKAVALRIDPVFSKHTHLIFIELTILCIPFIVHEIKKTLVRNG